MMNHIAGYEMEVKVNPAFVRENEIDSLFGSTDKLSDIIGDIEKEAFSKTLRDMFEA
jgi:GDP-D-mannose dehydratase